MPILPAEPDCFPPSVMDVEPPQLETERSWWVLHTRPRQEKRLASLLHHGEIPFFLPLHAKRHKVRGRVLTAQVPLFASYIFARLDPSERVRALATNRVVRSLKVTDQALLWRQLRQLYQMIRSGAPVAPEDRLGPGVLVEVRSGPLAGMRGRILRSVSGRRFVVEIDFIQRGASVLLDDYTLTMAC